MTKQRALESTNTAAAWRQASVADADPALDNLAVAIDPTLYDKAAIGQPAWWREGMSNARNFGS